MSGAEKLTESDVLIAFDKIGLTDHSISFRHNVWTWIVYAGYIELVISHDPSRAIAGIKAHNAVIDGVNSGRIDIIAVQEKAKKHYASIMFSKNLAQELNDWYNKSLEGLKEKCKLGEKMKKEKG